MYPELAGQERRTSKIIEKYLLDLGLEVKTGIGGHGVIGILKGREKGKKIAWRADMDAIKIETNDTFNYHSKNKGIAHMCGHDAHTTIGLGIADVLANQKETLKGTVYFIFQPAEETFKGAKAMINDGLFDLIKPDEIYGAHISPSKSGIISTKYGEMFAYKKIMKATFKFRNNKEKLKITIDSILQGLNRSKSNSKPWQVLDIKDSEIGIESSQTIFLDYLITEPYIDVIQEKNLISLEFSFFETNKSNFDSIKQNVKNKILETKHKNDFISVEYSGGDPTVYNDEKLTKTALETMHKIYGDKAIIPLYGQIPFSNEDFIYFQQKIPGVFFFIGGSNFDKDLIAMPHTGDFAIDEETIKFGVQRFSSLVLERMKSE